VAREDDGRIPEALRRRRIQTVNLRKDATPEDVKAVFVAAFDAGCKGITVYRNGSRSNQANGHADGVSAATKGRGCSCSECVIE